MARIDNCFTIAASDWIQTMLPLLQEGLGLEIHPAGTSMWPFVVGGRDHVIVHLAKHETLRRGNILLYERADKTLILHRIIHIDTSGIYCLGDSQTIIEGPIRREDAYAVATCIIRKGRRIDCNNTAYRLLSRLWLLTRPFRPLIFRIFSFKNSVIKRFFR